MSPGDLGEVLKPFVFLDRFDLASVPFSGIGLRRQRQLRGHHGAAEGAGKRRPRMVQGRAAPGTAAAPTARPGRAASSSGWRSAPNTSSARSRASTARRTRSRRPGRRGCCSAVPRPPSRRRARSAIRPRLAAGERWTYQPPAGHIVGWAAVRTGSLRTPDPAGAGELVVFEPGEAAIFETAAGAEFVIGSATPHRHDLVLGSYSVHTGRASLAAGEAWIREIGRQLRSEGRL